MYYEFYVDVFFVVNLVMDFLLLCLVNRILSGSATPGRSLLGAAAGAVGTCILWVFYFGEGIFGFTVLQGICVIFMIAIACRPKTAGEFLMGVISFAAFSLLAGGILTAVPVGAKENICVFLLITGATYRTIIAVVRLWTYLKGKVSAVCEVTLDTGRGTMKVKGLLDTGNHLRDPVSQKPVCVLEYACFQKLIERDPFLKEALDSLIRMSRDSTKILEGCEIRNFSPRYIPYRCVGTAEGLLLVITLKEMELSANGKQKRIKKAAVGLSKNRLSSSGNFQIIIHPDLWDSEGGAL